MCYNYKKEAPTKYFKRKYTAYGTEKAVVWDVAKKSCEDKGGLLANVFSKEDQRLLEKEMNAAEGKVSFWIGLSNYSPYNADQWVWTNGAARLPWSWWDPGNPRSGKRYCVGVNNRSPSWNGCSCD